jgi:hypothetical protein|tara:strand:- start:1015 stop:1158 length:144 start_codon:yes stop_codon:yes gene_type:complete
VRARLLIVREVFVVEQPAGVERVEEQIDAVEIDAVDAPSGSERRVQR